MAYTNRPRAILGPLTTVFTPAPQCTVAVGGGSTANVAWLGQRCNPEVEDDPGCWPETTEGAPATSQPLYGWGFYSPGLSCPAGYTSACTAIAGQSSGWKVQYQMEAEETFVGCCPTGFNCDNLNGQTCVVHPTATTVPTVSCESGSSNNFGYTTLPNAWVSQLHLFAPMIQLAWKPSDRPGSSSSSTVTSSSSSSSSTAAPTSPSSTPASQNEASLSTGAVIGIAIGAAAVFFLIVGVAIFIWRRRRRQAGRASPGGPDWPIYKAGGYSAVAAGDPSDAKQFHHVYTGVVELEPNSGKAEMPADSLGPAEMPGGDGRYNHAPRPVEMPAQRYE
ncbi:uncharacterized protein B0T15DRAFT_166960 [Chaetomium strumarium]|uniref:Uncharacterized protein n=1 Tax=Chaetomium strumarium TaxID=1170767 RepID=A0AAJ0M306_9PEZI|nr:hypothetical protein B0T15DRAFT_166960 [Chaetomium strumarium]